MSTIIRTTLFIFNVYFKALEKYAIIIITRSRANSRNGMPSQ